MRVSRTVLGEHCGAVTLCYSTLDAGLTQRFQLIQEQQESSNVAHLCEVLGVILNVNYLVRSASIMLSG